MPSPSTSALSPVWNCPRIYSGRNTWLALALLTTLPCKPQQCPSPCSPNPRSKYLMLSCSSALGRKVQDRTSVASSVWKKKSNQASVQWWKVRLPFTQTRGPWTAPYAKPIWETMIRNETLWQFHLEVSTNGQPCKWVALSVSVKWASNLQWPLTVNNIRQSYSANFINSQKFKRKWLVIGVFSDWFVIVFYGAIG